MKFFFIAFLFTPIFASAQFSNTPHASATNCGHCDWELVIDLSESISGHDLGVWVVDGLGDIDLKYLDQTLDLNIPAHRNQIAFELDVIFLTQGTTIQQDSLGGTILTISIPRVTSCISLSHIVTISEPMEPAPFFTTSCPIRRMRMPSY